jgi:hypothetical protein
MRPRFAEEYVVLLCATLNRHLFNFQSEVNRGFHVELFGVDSKHIPSLHSRKYSGISVECCFQCETPLYSALQNKCRRFFLVRSEILFGHVWM